MASADRVVAGDLSQRPCGHRKAVTLGCARVQPAAHVLFAGPSKAQLLARSSDPPDELGESPLRQAVVSAMYLGQRRKSADLRPPDGHLDRLRERFWPRSGADP